MAEHVFSDYLLQQLVDLHSRVVAKYGASFPEVAASDPTTSPSQTGARQGAVQPLALGNVSSAGDDVAINAGAGDDVDAAADDLATDAPVRYPSKRSTSTATDWLRAVKAPNWQPQLRRDTSVASLHSFQEELQKADQGRAFHLCSVWIEDLDGIGSSRSALRPLSRMRSNSFDLRSSSTQDSEFSQFNRLSAFESLSERVLPTSIIIHPSSKKRLTWDFMGMLLIIYDMIMLPIQVFEPAGNTFTDIMAWLARIFWTLDLPMSFLVGYLCGGVLILNPGKIAKKYLSTWFSLDIFLVTLDWILAATEAQENTGVENLSLARLGKTFRIMRLLRLLRLLRLMKLPKYFMIIEERIQSEYVAVVIGISKLTACILMINHCIGCLWYALGTVDGPTWLEAYKLRDAPFWVRYTTSLHWSLTQFTPASMEVHPQNVDERAFSLVVLIFAMIVFSSFVSSITNAMTQLRNMNSEYAKQLLTFQRYIRYHKISTPLAVRMRRHLEKKLFRGRQKKVDERDVELLKQLSMPLLMELRLEVFKPIIEQHPFLQVYCEVNTAGMKKICHGALQEHNLSHGDTLFSFGEIADKMHLVSNGMLRYFCGVREDNERCVDFVKFGEWLSEACLWTPWAHCGQCDAVAGTTLVCLEVSRFHDMVHSTSGLMRPSRYAQLFVAHLNSLQPWELTDLYLDSFDMKEALQECLVDLGGDIDLQHLDGESSTRPEQRFSERQSSYFSL